MSSCWKRYVAVAIVVFVAGSVKGRGQAETQGEKQQREEVQAMRDRRAEAASTQKAHDDNAAANQQRISDEAELKRLRATAPAREAAARAREAADRNARAADEEAYLSRAGALMDAAHIRDRKQAITDLAEHPIPVPAPGSVTECDSLAAARYDETRPLGLDGIPGDLVNAPAAVAACREQAAREPGSVRAKFELARALVLASRCDEAYAAIDTAIAAGSSAAAYLYATTTLAKTLCVDPKALSREAALRRAYTMGNADAGHDLLDVLFDAYQKAQSYGGKDNATSNAIWKERNGIEEGILTLISKRADERDNHALYLRASIAQATGSRYFGYNSIYVLYQCVVRGYEPCKQFDRFR